MKGKVGSIRQRSDWRFLFKAILEVVPRQSAVLCLLAFCQSRRCFGTLLARRNLIHPKRGLHTILKLSMAAHWVPTATSRSGVIAVKSVSACQALA